MKGDKGIVSIAQVPSFDSIRKAFLLKPFRTIGKYAEGGSRPSNQPLSTVPPTRKRDSPKLPQCVEVRKEID